MSLPNSYLFFGTKGWLRNQHPKRSTSLYDVICSRTPSTLTPLERLEAGRAVIFDFDYITPSKVDHDEFKQYFELMFLEKYSMSYLAFETFEQWKFKLMALMNSKMLGYSSVFDNTIYADNITFNDSSKTINTSSSNSNSTSQNESENTNSNYPQNRSLNVNNVRYANDGSYNISKASNDNASNSNSESVTITGNEIKNTIQYSKEFINLMENLLNEFQHLFSMMM